MRVLLTSIGMLFCGHVFANGSMLLITEINHKPYLLMVQANSKDYFVLPGGKEELAADLITHEEVPESIYETALRETTEETRGYLGRQLLKSVSNEKESIVVGKYTLFSGKVGFFPVDELKKIKIPKDKKWSPMNEIKNYAWVPIEGIVNHVQYHVKDSEGNEIQLHKLIPTIISKGQGMHWF